MRSFRENQTIDQKNEENKEIFVPISMNLFPREESSASFNYFDFLSNDMMKEIWKYLSLSDLGRTSSVCKRFHQFSEEMIKPLREKGVEAYREYLRQKERESKQLEVMKRKKQAKKMKWTCVGRHSEWILVFCILSMTILTVLKLEEVITTRWMVLFVPLFVFTAQVVSSILMYFTFAECFGYQKLMFTKSRHGPVILPASIDTLVDTKFRTISGLVLFVAWVILLSIKVDNPSSSLQFWRVFLPLLILLTLFVFIPLVMRWWSFRAKPVILLPMVTLIIFIAFLVIKLDGNVDWNWFFIMIPLWVTEGLIVLMSAPLYGVGALVSAIFTLGPLVAFQILLALKLEGMNSLRYVIVFIPVFVMEGILFCGCCLISICP
eukprot:TRINITY_DN13779_c0_g1_i1.p1 TRINITY_DN13779_c0_g1~~TRINITY_DN13779_c0_g1_i1.p1  ORF type:complete len:396 (-),score=57.33 TRINITY_DN13779_c0_g1_i1:45-1178(-)